MSVQEEGIFKRIVTLQPEERSETIYDEWAQTYDTELNEQYGYLAPERHLSQSVDR